MSAADLGDPAPLLKILKRSVCLALAILRIDFLQALMNSRVVKTCESSISLSFFKAAMNHSFPHQLIPL